MENWSSRRVTIAPSAELFDVPLEQPFGTIRAEAVRKISFRVLVDIGFQLRPVTLIIPDLLAARADGKQPTQDLDPIDRLLQFCSALANPLLQKIARLSKVLFNLLPFVNFRFQLRDELPVVDLECQKGKSASIPTPGDIDHQNQKQSHHAPHSDMDLSTFRKKSDHQRQQ